MRVALAFPGCHRRGGVERVVWECARFLGSRDHEAHVFAAEWEQDGSPPHIRYHPVDMRKRPRFLAGASFFRQCSRRLDASAFDVVNPHGTVCPVGGVHWVHSVHRAWLERAREIFGPSSNRVRKQRVNPVHPILLHLEERHFGARAYDRLIVTTPQVRDDLHRLYGVPPSDVDVLGIGFSPDDFDPERRSARRDEMRERLGLRRADVALLFVANELERKGYRTVLEALALLGRPNVRLLVVGRPRAREVLRLADRHGVGPQVVACGPTADVAGFHAAADLFVLPTQYEAFCQAILEALGSGLPVVTSRIPGAADAIQPGINGVLVDDPRDARELCAVLEPLLERVTRDALSAKAPLTVWDYRWPILLERYEQILARHSAGLRTPEGSRAA